MIGNTIAAATPAQKAVAVVIVVAALVVLTVKALEPQRDKTVALAPDTIQGSRVPRIDVAAPTKTEMATFAMG